jgi:5-methylcytosine-specific restriction endonuclease McrA
MADLTSQEHFTRDDVCASCGKEAPEEVKHFIFIANGVASYGALNDY